MTQSNFKMIVTDLDGTYLRNDKTVSVFSQHIMNELRKQGYIFVVATARPIRSVMSIPNLTFDAGIFHNGAVVYNQKEFINSFGITEPFSVVERFLNQHKGYNIAVEAEDILYANFDSTRIWPGTESIYTKNFFEIKNLVADKIIVEVSSLEEMNEMKILLPDDLYIQLSENKIAMIMNSEATKINGIRYLAELYDVKMDEILSFGDDYNDIEMLKITGKGVAVSNALEVVKENADYICGNNDEDGVAKCLYTLFHEYLQDN